MSEPYRHMTDDEFAAAFLGGTSDDSRRETLDQVEQFKRAKPEALQQMRADLSNARALRERAEATHDQLDSALWLAEELVCHLQRGGRELDQRWSSSVRRILRLLSLHFTAADPEVDS